MPLVQPREHVVLPSHGDGPDCPFDGVVITGNLAVFEKDSQRQRFLSGMPAANPRGDIGLGRRSIWPIGP